MRKSIYGNLLVAFIFGVYVFMAPLSIVSADNSGGTSTAEQVQANPSWVAPASYLALGDSLAAGMDHLGEMGDGYADYLAAALSETDLLKAFDKSFAENGYKASDVLKDIQENVTRDTADGEAVHLHDAIANAGLITISAGANDVLAHVDFDKETGSMEVDEEGLQKEIQQVGMNLMKIVSMIHEINPDAQVYVMGYYNPFPHLPAELQPMLEQMLVGLNTAIGAVKQLPNTEVVDTANVVAADFKSHLPNPQNIHLSPAGYAVVAKQFVDKVQAEYAWIPSNAFIAESIATDSVKLHWKAPSSGEAAHYEVFNGEELLATVEGDVDAYTVEGLKDNEMYTFFLVAIDADGNRSEENPEVTVTTEALTPLFTDIKGHADETAIEMAVALGIFNGYDDGTFKPEDALTRAQAATVFVRALDLPVTDVIAVPFTDIMYYAGETQAAIQAAYANGIIQGADGKFNPIKDVTRAQFVQMAWRVIEKDLGGDFPDSNTFEVPTDMGEYDAKTVQVISTLSELGFITLDDGKFNPNAPATRAFAASMLVHLVNYSAK